MNVLPTLQPEMIGTVWCAGLPLVAHRPLTPEERATIHREGHLALKVVIGCLLTLPVTVMGSLLMMNLFSGRHLGIGGEVFGFLCTAFLVIILTLQVVLGVRGVRRWQQTRADLRLGFVRRFEGILNQAVPFDETYRFLVRRALLTPKAPEAQSLEVLAASQRLWQLNDQPAPLRFPVRWTETAPTPEFAAMAAQWLDPVAQTEEGTLLAGRRELSPAERAELHLHIRRLQVRMIFSNVILSCVFYSDLSHTLQQGGVPSAGRLFWLLFLGGFTLLNHVALLSSIWLSQRYRADLRAGFVHIFRMRPLTETEAEQPEREVLPSSRSLWTEGGLPAAWRKVAH